MRTLRVMMKPSQTNIPVRFLSVLRICHFSENERVGILVLSISFYFQYGRRFEVNEECVSEKCRLSAVAGRQDLRRLRSESCLRSTRRSNFSFATHCRCCLYRLLEFLSQNASTTNVVPDYSNPRVSCFI